MGNRERLQFGIFEFQPATGELRRNGVLVRLQAQPAQVLDLLLRNAGQVVTRAELKEALWGTETFVDFDRGVNFCIAQIRAALGDSAEASIYIRTLPKRGYQFIAPVTPCADDHPEVDPGIASRPASPRPKSSLGIGSALLVTAIGVLMLFARFPRLLWQPNGTSTTPAIRVAVARFDNDTGDAKLDSFADALSDSVTAKLTLSGNGRYGVIGNAAILRAPRSQRDLLAIAASLHAGYIVLAQVRQDPSHCFVLAHLIRLPDQTHIAVTELNCPVGASSEVLSRLADQITGRFSPLIKR